MKATKLLKRAIRLKDKHKLLSHFIVLILRYVFAFEAYVSTNTEIGENVIFKHNGLGCVLHPSTKIGNNCWIYQNVTLGANTNYINDELNNTGAPIIGANTVIYSGAVIAGPVIIGENCVIGANCVITKNIPANSIVTGNQIKISERYKDIEYITPKGFKVNHV